MKAVVILLADFNMSMKSISRIYAGNLPWSVGVKELGQYFSQFGRVFSVKVNYDKKKGKSKGFGFVTFKDSQSADAAVSHVSHVLEGNILRVDKSNN